MTKSRKVVALCLSTGLVGAAHAASVSDHTTRQLTMHFAGSGTHTLDVRDIEGGITVEAYDGSDVVMSIDESITATSNQAMRAAKQDVKLDTGDGSPSVHAIVRISHQEVCGDDQNATRNNPASGYSVRFDFKIRVPRAVRLQLCTINSGDIRVAGTAGDFDIRNINGRITMANVEGAGNATTINGAVTASFVASPQRASLFKTINGDVAITFPEGLSADLRMRSFNGRVLTDFMGESAFVPEEAVRETHDGATEIQSRSGASLRVGNGGPKLTLETLNGDVRVLRGPK